MNDAEKRRRKAEGDRRYRAKNKAKLAKSKRQWVLANAEKVAEQQRRWRVANAERKKALDRAYYLRNRERIRAEQRLYYRAHPEKFREAGRRYDVRHPQEKRDRTQMRRARIRGAAKVERIDRLAIYERDGRKCHICGRKIAPADLSMDHLIPISEGGEHTALNVRAAHTNCNARRGPGNLPAQLLLIA